jgi:hypothetical protein
MSAATQREIAVAALDHLLSPYSGVERGLLPTDQSNKVIGITVDELRNIASTMRLARDFIAEEQSL